MEPKEKPIVSCRVTPLYNVNQDDNLCPWYAFALDISTTFINSIGRQTFLVNRRELLDQTTPKVNLLDLLLEMKVPVVEDGSHVTVVNQILESARIMAASERLRARKILRLRVEIDVKMMRAA